jgi:excisionase family DNA binding protein
MRNTLSTSAVARLLGVAVGSVSNWIDRGQLEAGRTPGGHRRVTTDNLVAFLRRQKLPVPPELATAGPRALVVDDEPAVARWIAEELAARCPQLEVFVAHDGFSAGEIVASARPDVVILDLRMPGMDGFEVCRRIKSREDTQYAAVIAITAYPSEEAQRQIFECGAQAYLTKPLDMEALMAELDSVLARRV